MAIPRTYATAGAFRRALEERLKSMSRTERWHLELPKVFALAGEFQERPVPHRFRHTSVRILLERGVPVGDVAELVGDTERVLVRYYSKWILSHHARLSAILQEAFADKPKPNVLRMAGKTHEAR
jgi:integrase